MEHEKEEVFINKTWELVEHLKKTLESNTKKNMKIKIKFCNFFFFCFF